MRIPAPNFTQTPNDLFDEWLPKLGEVELKVLLVIMRKTFGWHRKKDKISISTFQNLTGSNRTNICTALNSLIEKGLVCKEIVGVLGTEEVYYELVVHEGGGSTNSVPPPSTNVVPPLVPTRYPPHLENNTYKKERIKENDDDAPECARATDCGNVHNFSKDDLFFAREKLDKDWTTLEIEKAWPSYIRYSGNIENPVNYIDSIIKKNRLIEQNQQLKEKPCSKNSTSEKDSKNSSPTGKNKSSEKDTAEPPCQKSNLGEMLRQSGFYNGSTVDTIF